MRCQPKSIDMELEQELNKRRAAPSEFWIGLALLTIAAIIAYILLNNSQREDQINIEKRTTYLNEPSILKTEFYGKEKI
jgi:hypothetical protein